MQPPGGFLENEQSRTRNSCSGKLEELLCCGKTEVLSRAGVRMNGS